MLLTVIYLSFISLGLPDGLLGAAWPSLYPELGVPVSRMGIISLIIAAGTVVSSLQSDRLTKKLGVGLVTALSVATTALSIFGFSLSRHFVALCLWAVPYGLGAGSVDAALNNYVALHYKSRHMNWLHCMWGVGASLGPLVMGFALSRYGRWHLGYCYIGILQAVLTAILFCTLPRWKRADPTAAAPGAEKAMPLGQVLKIPGVWAAMLLFFGYCAIEQTAGQWAATYLKLYRGFTAEEAARFASMFYIGITVGRGICGFVSFKLNDSQMMKLGFVLIALGILLFFLPIPALSLVGFILTGLGCAPVYPAMIHATPLHFGQKNSQAVIGVQMASAYVGTTLIPPVFGFIAGKTTLGILPGYLCLFLVLMAVMTRFLPKADRPLSPSPEN